MRPGLKDFLARFRPVGVAGRAGVPVDRWVERDRELAPVFAALAAVEERVGRIRRQAALRAEQRGERARREAAAIVTEARSRVDAVRADAAASATEEANAERVRAEAETARRAVELGAVIEERLPRYVDRAVDRALDWLSLDPASGCGRGVNGVGSVRGASVREAGR